MGKEGAFVCQKPVVASSLGCHVHASKRSDMLFSHGLPSWWIDEKHPAISEALVQAFQGV